MEEYEYSFKVKSIKPYIDYCEKNNYELEDITKQNRIVYENRYSEDIIARITTAVKHGKKTCVFDCKNVGKRDESLKISSESKEMKVTKGNREQIESILNVLNFYEAANNKRKRYIYKKDGVKFEIDDYTSPVMCVVGIEGERNKVDKVYEELKDIDNAQ